MAVLVKPAWNINTFEQVYTTLDQQKLNGYGMRLNHNNY